MDKVEDIVGRLRGRNERFQSHGGMGMYYGGGDSILDCDAADLIQSQQALIEEMREAFTVFMKECPDKLDCGRRCQLEIEQHEEEAFMAAYANAEAVLSKALSQKDQIDG